MSKISAPMTPSSPPERLHLTTKLAYGAGDFGPAIAANILVFYLLFFLTDVAGLPPGLAGSVLMIGKIFDAINDPIVGILSDRTQTRWGRRLPWMLLGIIPFSILNWAEWLIPTFSENPQWNQWALFAYYVLIGIGFNLSFTIVNLPYTALTPELTQNYNERTRLNSFRFAFSIGGSILSLLLYITVTASLPDQPQWQFFLIGLLLSVWATIALCWSALGLQERGKLALLPKRWRGQTGLLLMIAGATLLLVTVAWGLGALGGQGWDYRVFSAGIVGLMLLGFGFTLRDQKREAHLQQASLQTTTAAQEVLSLRQQIQLAFTNRPFLFVIGIYLCSWLAVQLTASILVYFVVSWMGLSEQESGLLALAVQGTALVMLFFWQLVAQRLDKKIIYCLGTVVWLLAELGLWLVQPGQVVALYGLGILAGFGVSVAYLIPWSMIPDVVDLDELNTGKRREGVFYAFMVLLQKIGLALGLFLVGLTLEAAGFVTRTAGQAIPTQPESALFAIRVAIAPLPAFFLLIGIILAWYYPISRTFHADILQQLEARHQNNQ